MSSSTPSYWFDGTSDVRKFLFTFGTVLTTSPDSTDRPKKQMRRHNGTAFDLYCKTFAPDGMLEKKNATKLSCR